MSDPRGSLNRATETRHDVLSSMSPEGDTQPQDAPALLEVGHENNHAVHDKALQLGSTAQPAVATTPTGAQASVDHVTIEDRANTNEELDVEAIHGSDEVRNASRTTTNDQSDLEDNSTTVEKLVLSSSTKASPELLGHRPEHEELVQGSVSRQTVEAPGMDTSIDQVRSHPINDAVQAEVPIASAGTKSHPDASPSKNTYLDELAAELSATSLEVDEARPSASADAVTQENVPQSPQAPAPPRKDSVSKQLRSIVTDPARPRGARDDASEGGGLNDDGGSENTGVEIESIMGQFQDGMGGMGETEIMTPRLERQHSALVLPPRSSSLEPKESYTISQDIGAPAITSPLSPQGTGKASIAGSIRGRTMADDQESIKSGAAGSIFQPPPPSPDPEPALPFDFHRFLEQLRHRTADPVARFLRSFLSEFAKKQWMVHEQVKIISDFLEFITKKMGQCEVWRTVSDIEFDNAREGMEKLVMNRLYSQTFSPAIPASAGSPRKSGRSARSQADAANPHGPGRRGQHQEDVERDDVIAQKIRIYGWINETHLDISAVGDKGKKFLSLAQQELLKINSYRAPRDKVICVLNCCKVIFGFLRNSKSDQSADSFVPLLIYTVLRARPEHLVSNVQYIWRFRNQDKLGGEAGYYMSSLMGVVSFIENLDRTNLTVTDEEFEKNVEQAVSAIAEKNRAEEYENRTHIETTAGIGEIANEKPTNSRPDVGTRSSTHSTRAAPQRSSSRPLPDRRELSTSGEEDTDPMSGLLRTIQKPLNSIGRMFSDDLSAAQPLKAINTPLTGSTPQRGLSPAPPPNRRPSVESIAPAERNATARRPSQQRSNTDAAAARQASVETAEAQRLQAQEYKVVIETLENMFPGLDKDVIEDVVHAQEGNVGRAVDACLAMSG